MPYLSASEVVFHEEALYQVYVQVYKPLPLPWSARKILKSQSLYLLNGCVFNVKNTKYFQTNGFTN